jgi:cob(I)alamin adenosyltransferase
MVKLNKIYTKTGDDGTTGLVRGPRRMKHDVRVHAYGDVDEANAQIGLVRLQTARMPRIDNTLGRIQNDLFDVGSDLATPGRDDPDGPASLRVTEAQIVWLEGQIDLNNNRLQPLSSFVLPGGTPLATQLHIARTIVRRAERAVVELMATEAGTGQLPMRYLNRLSDLLFVLARVANDDGAADVLWSPGRYAEPGRKYTVKNADKGDE